MIIMAADHQLFRIIVHQTSNEHGHVIQTLGLTNHCVFGLYKIDDSFHGLQHSHHNTTPMIESLSVDYNIWYNIRTYQWL